MPASGHKEAKQTLTGKEMKLELSQCHIFNKLLWLPKSEWYFIHSIY